MATSRTRSPKKSTKPSEHKPVSEPTSDVDYSDPDNAVVSMPASAAELVDDHDDVVPEPDVVPVVRQPLKRAYVPPTPARARVTLREASTYGVHGMSFVKGVPQIVVGRDLIAYFKSNSRFHVVDL